ncbi:MAG: hypothetical protein R2729_32975 [Bryobacteraceae bacterium]
MKLPRHAEIWAPGYFRSRMALGRWRPGPGPVRVWVAITDHYEPYWHNTDDGLARERVARWRQRWPEVAARNVDSAGKPACYSFFYPEEEYRPELLDPLAEMTADGIGDVEIHVHHDGDTEAAFVERMEGFLETLERRHGLLRRVEGRRVFGFIHGNWCLDNSRPDGRWCGLNNEITLLERMGCYADFTMPSGPSPTQARQLNEVYWAVDDPARPKSYDTGPRYGRGESGGAGRLLMIPGPFGLRWGGGRVLPRMDTGELAGYDAPGADRARVWLAVAPRIGNDIFVKLYSHGTQEKNSAMLFEGGGLDTLYGGMAAECRARGWEYRFVSAWEMYRAVTGAAA